MSEVTCIIIKNKHMKIYRGHFREIEKIIKSQPKQQVLLSDLFDSGYLLIDYDNHLIVDEQDSLNVQEIIQNKQIRIIQT